MTDQNRSEDASHWRKLAEEFGLEPDPALPGLVLRRPALPSRSLGANGSSRLRGRNRSSAGRTRSRTGAKSAARASSPCGSRDCGGLPRRKSRKVRTPRSQRLKRRRISPKRARRNVEAGVAGGVAATRRPAEVAEEGEATAPLGRNPRKLPRRINRRAGRRGRGRGRVRRGKEDEVEREETPEQEMTTEEEEEQCRRLRRRTMTRTIPPTATGPSLRGRS